MHANTGSTTNAQDESAGRPTPGSPHDAALGAVLGALAGDAAGAVLGLQAVDPTAVEVDRALTFPGGGVWMVAPGQITDDGELTMCLLQAIAESNGYSPDHTACWYGRWYRSAPFDVGAAQRAGLPVAAHPPEEEQGGLAMLMRTAARANSMTSKANGSLMRATPLGIWGHRHDDGALAEFSRIDSALTHPNASCTDAVACYAIAIAALVRSPGDRGGAFAAARAWADHSACEEVRSWLDDAEHDRRPPYRPKMGFVKIAFTEAFRHLLLGTAWERAVRETLLGGGDTDTNACIVGGLVGAAVGASGVPEGALKAVLKAEQAFGRRRPEWLHPRAAPELVLRLVG